MHFGNPTPVSGHYEWVFPLDDAFDNGIVKDTDDLSDEDKEAALAQNEKFLAAHREWLDTGNPELIMPFIKDGHRPAWFRMKHLSSKQMHYVSDFAAREGNAQAAYEAVRLALKSIRVDGAQAPTWKPEISQRGWELVPESTMEMLHNTHPALIVSMGTHASNKARPSKN